MIRSIRYILISVAIFAAPIAASAANVPLLKSSAAQPPIDASQYASLLVIDVPSGKTLYKLNPTKPWTAASLTKLMTAHAFTQTSRNWGAQGNILAADEVGGGRLQVAAGSVMTLQNILYSAIVGSANNAAEALARLSGVGRDPFIDQMNKEAARIGLSNSTFHDAAGMDPTNTTTAYDMAMLVNKAAEHPEIQKSMVTFTYNFTVASPRLAKSIKNTNGLLYIEPDVWVTAGKTGYLHESMHNLVTTVEPSPRIATNGGELAIVVFGAPDRDAAARATAALAKWAWASFDWSGDTVTLARNMGEGDKGADARALQKYLNAHGAPVATSGPGSPGQETTLFGALTKAALTKFQTAHAADVLVPQGRAAATGYLDDQTRAFINGAVTPSIDEPQTPAPAPAVATAPPSASVSASTPNAIQQIFSRTLTIGDRGNDVIALQRWLNINGFQLANVGPGAPGSETTYFGSLTQDAVRRFQQAKNLQITGILDDSTRAQIVK